MSPADKIATTRVIAPLQPYQVELLNRILTAKGPMQIGIRRKHTVFVQKPQPKERK